MASVKDLPELNEWTFFRYPSENVIRIIGKIQNDKRFGDGKVIVTSQIKFVDLINNIARTANTEYRLGTRKFFNDYWKRE